MHRKSIDSCKKLGVWATLAVATLPGLVGCTSDIGGQTLPSPYYLTDDVQYFPPGTEFKLSREAAAMQATEADAAAAGGAPGAMPGAPGAAPMVP